jgi:hypothetical protein
MDDSALGLLTSAEFRKSSSSRSVQKACMVYRRCNTCSATFQPLCQQDTGYFRGADVFCKRECARVVRTGSSVSFPEKHVSASGVYKRLKGQLSVYETEEVSAIAGVSVSSESHVVAVGTPDFSDGADILRLFMVMEQCGIPEAAEMLQMLNDAIAIGSVTGAGAMFHAAAVIHQFAQTHRVCSECTFTGFSGIPLPLCHVFESVRLCVSSCTNKQQS